MSPNYSWLNCLLIRLDGPGCFLVLFTSSNVCAPSWEMPSSSSESFEKGLPRIRNEMGRKIILFHKNIVTDFLLFDPGFSNRFQVLRNSWTKNGYQTQCLHTASNCRSYMSSVPKNYLGIINFILIVQKDGSQDSIALKLSSQGMKWSSVFLFRTSSLCECWPRAFCRETWLRTGEMLPHFTQKDFVFFFLTLTFTSYKMESFYVYIEMFFLPSLSWSGSRE